MRAVVTGGRKFQDRALVFKTLDTIHAATPITHLAEGGAPGADRLAGLWARARSIEHTTFPAAWDLGPMAGPLRNAQMLDDFKPALVVAFRGGAGTASCCRLARERSIPVKEIR